jgi:predicted permease
VVIVNETLAKHFWPGQNPIGKRVRYPWSSEKDTWMEVVGLTRDVKHYGLDVPMRPSVYVPYRRFPNEGMTLVLRGSIDPGGLIAPARRILRELDPDLPMFEVRTMTERLERSLWARRAYSSLFAAFAVVALVLATTGIYGVVSYAVAQRTHEIGVRMALGARPKQVMAQVLRHGLTLAALGLVLGLAAALAAARVLESLLFGVSPRDPFTYAIVAGGVLATALAANLVPARRAASIDPMRALRVE